MQGKNLPMRQRRLLCFDMSEAGKDVLLPNAKNIRQKLLKIQDRERNSHLDINFDNKKENRILS